MRGVKSFLATLSSRPGVYRMHDKHGVILYVGKARDLKKRVSSYFRAQLPEKKTKALMAQVDFIEVTLVDNENEALLLEANLIKEHRPRYNVLLRDDKSYPYLYLSTEQSFPRLDFHRGSKRSDGRYFGPYPNAGSVRENLSLIQKLFKLRQCRDSFFSHRTRPCLQYQINRCTAPCVGKVSAVDYAEQVQHAILFLEGKDQAVMNDVADKMERASQAKHYELAAEYRDVVVRLRQLQRKQMITADHGNIDVLGVESSMGKLAVAVLFIRAGRVIGHKTYFPNVPRGTDLGEAVAAFIPQYYLSSIRSDLTLEKIIVNVKVPQKEWIESALQQRLGGRVKIMDFRHHSYRSWLSIVEINAKNDLGQLVSDRMSDAHKLVSLKTLLGLANPIDRIECFDVSHTQGEKTVASCVVYGTDGAIKKDYRRFNITDITPGDDYAAMRQALLRRYTRLKSQDEVLPDVLMIDGGVGQLRQAAIVMESLQVSGVELLGIAKGPSRKPGCEKLWLWGKKVEQVVAVDSPALHLIQYIRDEAHRFAISGHRARRSKAQLSSPLEAIAGVGAKRRQALLRHFGGMHSLTRATEAEIAKVPGINSALAKAIYEALH